MKLNKDFGLDAIGLFFGWNYTECLIGMDSNVYKYWMVNHAANKIIILKHYYLVSQC